ncbi:MAG: 16S rRNA (cytidine(1402)-2'-O)-methyltransferase [Bacillota bacterium]
MNRLSSYKSGKARLYLVATPIGNLEDMTYRAVRILNEVSTIYAEDTRTSGVLLKHYGIKTPLRSYHKHNEMARLAPILEALKKGKDVALISDAGTPLLSDPGETLVKEIVESGFPVVPIPGASAALNALIMTGLPTVPHQFVGFLPSKESARESALKALRYEPRTLVFYESPHRIQSLVDQLRTLFDRRKVVIVRELSKQYEERIDFYSDEAVDVGDLKGEMVVVVEGFTRSLNLDKEAWIDRIELLMEDGMKEKDAIKTVANEQGIKKNDVYMTYQVHKQQFSNQKQE